MLAEIVKRVEGKGFRVRVRDVENVLLAAKEPVTVWQLIARSDVAQNVAEEIVKELKEEGLVEFENGKIRLSEKGEELVAGKGFKDWSCEHCKGRGVKIFEDIADEFLKIAEKRPKAVHEFDQGYVLPEVTLARVAHMDMRGDIRGRDIIILGDDDLVSIAIGLTGLANSISVLEIDPRLKEFIGKVSREYGLDIEFLQFDLRNPLPDEFIGKFDTFECDPVETLPGFKMFVGRGLAALKGPGGAGYFGLTRIETDLFKWHEIQKTILELGAVITDLIPKFNWYENWDYYSDTKGWERMPPELRVAPQKPWYNSAWYRIELVRKAEWNEPVSGEEVYFDELTSTV